jgi:hypothetical protein
MPMTFEPIRCLDEEVELHPPDEPVLERLVAMANLCRAAWLAAGNAPPLGGRAHRGTLPGELYRTDYDVARRTP